MTTNLKKQLEDQINGQSNEYRELVIQNESQKFVEIFDRVFTTAEPNETEDAVDGIVEDILNAIVSRVKAIIKQKFVKEIIYEKENGEDESSSETEA